MERAAKLLRQRHVLPRREIAQSRRHGEHPIAERLQLPTPEGLDLARLDQFAVKIQRRFT
jgi:hypothetical protein